MLASIRERLRWNIGYMKEMVSGDNPFFFEKGKFRESASLVDVRSSTLSDYYTNCRSIVTHYHLWSPMIKPDEDGVTRADYSRWGHAEIGIQYHPIAIAQYALGNFELFLDTGSDDYRQSFFAQVGWLMKNARITRDGTAVWEFHYNYLPYNVSIPWVSAMAQGQIISVLLRAFQLTGEVAYCSTAKRALGAFHFSIYEGGVTWKDDDGFAFYEEWPSQPLSHILNGHIWAMFGLYDYYRVTNSQDASDMFNAGVDTLKRYLPRYDTGYWSRYDLLTKPGYAPIRYQHYHTELLRVLFEITREEIFNNYVRRWSSYLKPWRKAKFAFFVASHRMREYLGNRLRPSAKP